MTLAELGWDPFFADAFEPYRQQGLSPGRVSARHRGEYELLTEEGSLRAEARAIAAAVGDWVAIDLRLDERRATIHAVLPRRTKFSRKEPWLRSEEQIIAANIDTVFVVTALPNDVNLRRLERYLAAAWDSGAAPVVVLTKTDLCPDRVAETLAKVEAIALGVPAHALSCVTGEGVEEVRRYVAPGRTAALLGSSGVGKSTIVNRLLGRELLATGDLRADGRGRHTTTRRELLLLPGGGLVLDTPGLRELQLWDGGGVEDTFAEIAELAGGCRFNDCSHLQEPGCAVLAALAAGTLPPERLASYRKLERELAALERKRDRTAAIEYRRRWRAIAKANRARRNA